MSCETCKKKTTTPESIPYAAYELSMAQAERTAKRLWITILTLIFLLVGSNCAWLWWNNQWETVESWEITQENEGGNNNYIGNDGDITNNP